jgi:drug/metabolite transporter (DMT)-like permease
MQVSDVRRLPERIDQLPAYGAVQRALRAALPTPMAVGLALAFVTAIISGFSIFINSYAVKEFDSPTLFTTMKNTVVGVTLLALLFARTNVDAPAVVRGLTARQRLGLIALGVIGGSVPFVLFFEGLSRVDSGNAAFLHKTLFVWVALLAVVLLKERLGRAQIAALALLFLAQWLTGGPGALRPGAGETMVFVAALLWSVEVIVAKQLLPVTGSQLAATARMAIGAVLLLGYLALRGDLGAIGDLGGLQWAWVLGTGAILLGYVVTWYAALERAPATAVTCVLTVGAPITAALHAIAGHGFPDAEAWAGYGVLLVAVGAIVALAAASRRGPAPATVAAAVS